MKSCTECKIPVSNFLSHMECQEGVMWLPLYPSDIQEACIQMSCQFGCVIGLHPWYYQITNRPGYLSIFCLMHMVGMEMLGPEGRVFRCSGVDVEIVIALACWSLFEESVFSMIIAVVALKLQLSNVFFFRSRLFIAKTCGIFLLLDMFCGMYTPTSSTAVSTFTLPESRRSGIFSESTMLVK